MCNLAKLFKKRLLFERFIKRAKNTSFKMTNILTPIPYRRESATGDFSRGPDCDLPNPPTFRGGTFLEKRATPEKRKLSRVKKE